MFGSHLSTAGGAHNALTAAESLSHETVQIFTANQRQWASKPLDPAAVEAFRAHAGRLGFTRIVAHASYLINLAAIDGAMWEKSLRAFAQELERCDALGVTDVVIHPGAHCGSGEACGLAKVAEALNVLFDAQKQGRVRVCLETTAGQGSCLGCRFEQLAEMIDRTEHKERLGVCVDTCHILAAGYDITTTQGTEQTLRELDATIGIDRVRVWHLNDSKKPLGSRVDRHEHIGRGCVGVPAFATICRDPRFAAVPKILETSKDPAPDGRDWDIVNMELLRGLAAGQDLQPAVFKAPRKKLAAKPKPSKAKPKRHPVKKVGK